jgi:hypothetical protein
VGDELVETVEGDERRDFEHTLADGAGSRFLLETLLQLVLHGFKLSTANIAEPAQGVRALGGSGLNFLWS